MTTPFRTLDALPLFATEAEIGAAVLGAKKAWEWPAIAHVLENTGLPKVDVLMGGRYVPAVKAYFDKEYGLATLQPAAAPRGVERPETWNQRQDHKRRVSNTGRGDKARASHIGSPASAP